MANSRCSARQQAEARGRRAETLAALFLQMKFYRILDRRVKTPVGEVDLIAQRGGVLAFIEVKQRNSLELCQSAVPPQAWQRISAAGASWAARHSSLAQLDWRYDLIGVIPGRLPLHLRDFWRP